MKAALVLTLGFGSFVDAFEVHEWGTFTVLSGSDGVHVPWYLSSEEIAGLPEFVSKPLMDKSGHAKIRMETPVIYFYPEKEMGVSVDVSFVGGKITETFPHSSGTMVIDPVTSMFLTNGAWKGTLHPPTDLSALSEIPAILKSGNPEPYGAAREVPEAWIFESDVKEFPGLQVQPHFPQMEKFIFYRGAGNGYIPIQATMEGDEVTVTNNAEEEIPFAVALRVRSAKAAWLPIVEIPGQPVDKKPAINTTTITFPKAERSLDEVESELATEWKKALAIDGLTPAEASAMVETWRKTWFRESGDRLLTLVPRKVTDAMLPLKIIPAAEKIERVFVARIEMISPDREETLVDLLNSPGVPGEVEFTKFQKLELGRLGNGAMQVVTQLQMNRMSGKYYALKQFGEERKTSGR